MLGMARGLVFHNAMQLSIPFWLTAVILYSFPRLDFYLAGSAAVIGSLIPDLDHFSMWGKVDHKKGLLNFVKYCIKADRYRKAFLPFHNHLAIYIVGVVAFLTYFVNFYVSIFFIAFLVHQLFDYVADLYLIKQHTHWRLRNWFDAGYSGLSASQQVQQGDKQKHDSGKPRSRR